MKVTWLTQAGLFLETPRIKIMIDPYLSNSVGERNPKKNRRIPVNEAAFELVPDAILITHDHLDHLDPATVTRFLDNDRFINVFAPECAYKHLLELGYDHNYVLMSPHTVWSQSGVTIYAVHAEHSDRTAVGYIIDDGDRTYYISGDTLYNYDVIDDVLDLAPDGVDFAFLPINGVGNNMNARDAADLAYEIGAKCAIPLHYGLFDSLTPDEFDFDDKLLLEPFKTIEI